MMSSAFSSPGLRAATSFLCLAMAVQALPRGTRRSEDPFTRQACFVSAHNEQRLLTENASSSESMTVEACAAFCSSYHFFGLEYGRECYCGNSYPEAAVSVADSECSFSCSGDSTQTCGAGNRIEIYRNNNWTSRTPAALEVPYLGCYKDEGSRVLPNNLLAADDMTAEKCAQHCSSYAFFGVEYGRECWCSNRAPELSLAAPEADCSFPCAGNNTQICGASGRINVWGALVAPVESPNEVDSFNWLGCFTDNIGSRSLVGPVFHGEDMTLEKCAANCADYGYFGVEYGTQCFCGNRLRETAEEVDQAECAMPCGGDNANVCGDADRLTVYVSKDCHVGPDSPTTVGSFQYQSCRTDSVSSRALLVSNQERVLRADDMTVEKCAEFCDGYSYFGVEYGNQCFCGDQLSNTSQEAPEEECAYLCKGNPLQLCGAADRLNVYAVATAPDS